MLVMIKSDVCSCSSEQSRVCRDSDLFVCHFILLRNNNPVSFQERSNTRMPQYKTPYNTCFMKPSSQKNISSAKLKEKLGVSRLIVGFLYVPDVSHRMFPCILHIGTDVKQ